MNILQQAFGRTLQKVMYVSEFMMPWRKAEFTKGPGSFLKLPELVLSKGIKSVLIVTDKFLSENVLPDLIEKMDKKGLKYSIYDGVVPNPTIKCIEEGLKLYKSGGCEAIIAIGGGSPMDCAKIIGARVVRPNKPARRFKGLLQVLHKLPPFFAVPTTSGTGSEVTLAAVISDPERKEKFPCNDPSLIPHYVVLDPVLTETLPGNLTSTTGMDALTHAVEAYIGHSNTKQTAKDAVDAVKLIFENVEIAYSEPNNLKARENMQIASMLAGRAFTRAYVGYVHAIGHAFGAIVNMPHGLAMSIILPNMLDNYGATDYKRLAELADAVGIKGVSVEEKAKKFIQEIKDMNARMGIPAKIGGKYAITDEQVNEIAVRANAEANPLYPCPKLFNLKELKVIVNNLREK